MTFKSAFPILVATSLFLAAVQGQCSSEMRLTANSRNEGPFYVPSTPLRNRLAPENQLVDPADVLVVEGQLFGNDCVPIANAKIEIWYAGYPDRYGNYYSQPGSALNYRGTIITDTCGWYQFVQVFPVQFVGSPHDHLRVSLGAGADSLLVTEMYFEETMVPNFHPDTSQVVTTRNQPDGSRSTTFNMKVGIPGTADPILCGDSSSSFSGEVNFSPTPAPTSDGSSSAPISTAFEDAILVPTDAPTTTTSHPTTSVPITEAPTTAPQPNTPTPTGASTSTPTSGSVASSAFAGRNDRCELAHGPLRITPTGSAPRNQFTTTTVGSTANVPVPEHRLETCNGVRSTSASVWHTVIGSGGVMMASTCWPGTDYDTKLTIYGSSSSDDGNDCAALTCVTGNDDIQGGSRACKGNPLASRVVWKSQKDEVYRIMVHGFASRVGQYELSVESLNDKCAFAASLSGGDTVIGDTSRAGLPFDGKIGNCGGRGTVGGNGGLFYSVLGTGQRMEVSTCNAGTQIATKIHIFEASCEDLNKCIAGEWNQNGCSTLQWETQPFVEYFVLVHGHVPVIGTFELSLSVVE